MSVLAVALGLVSIAACTPQPPVPAVAWQAIYVPTEPEVLIRAAGQRICITRATVRESASAIEVSVTGTARHAKDTCTGSETLTRAVLAQPVGRRTIVPARHAPPGTSVDLTSRLHQPIRGPNGFPSGASIISQAVGTQWVLVYPATTTQPGYELTSTADPGTGHPTGGTVRGQPQLAPCSATLCWSEDHLLYQFQLFAHSPITDDIELARTLASTLTH